MIPNRLDPKVAGEILRRLLPEEVSRKAVLNDFASSIRFADGLDPGRWAVTLATRMVRLNVGWVEAFAVFSDCAHVVCRHDLLPQHLLASNLIRRHYQPGGIYGRWAPESCCINLPARDAARVLPELRPSHEELIRDTVRSPIPASTRRAHSPGVILWLNAELGSELTQPSFVPAEVSDGSRTD